MIALKGISRPTLYNWLGKRVRRFVLGWRLLDARLNRPLSSGRGLLWRWLAPDGYAWFVPILAFVLVVAMALGPTFVIGYANLSLLLMGLVLLLLLHALAARYPSLNQYLLAGQLAILAILTVALVVTSVPEVYGPSTGRPRLHIGAAIACALIVGISAAWLLTRTLFRSDAGGTLAASLPKVELFLPNDRYDFMGRGPLAALVSAFSIVPIRYPVELLLPGSLLTLFVPDHYLCYVFGLGAAFCWIALFLGILFDRLMEILQTLGRLFFIGPQRVISILVIVVAVLRLADVHYITYLFNAGSSGYGNITIMRYIALAYAVAWYYAFWCDSFVARRIIRLLDGKGHTATPIEISYDFEGDPTLSTVKNLGRTIALHGAGRLKIEGQYENGTGRALQFMTPAELLSQFRIQLERTPRGIAPGGDLLASLRNLQRSTIVYPVIVGTLAFGLIGIPTFITFEWSIQPPELAIASQEHVDVDLPKLLFAQKDKDPCSLPADAPRIAVAASGGGTRAAIYTASLLRGLAANGKICNVVLVSGVSGGSAALAYFALHEDELRQPGKMNEGAWDQFSKVMALPYIEYAVDRASDLRIAFGRDSWRSWTCGETEKTDRRVVGWQPARSRLGSILAESFVCAFGKHSGEDGNLFAAAGTMQDPRFGIILNTSIVGSFVENGGDCGADLALPLFERASRCRKDYDAGSAGGRLVLTNIATPAPPPADGSLIMELVTLNNSDISIARAAALSANFPPVFPDAAIDVDATDGSAKRYWVTDGGAVENRGAMTLYYAVRDAFRAAPQGPGKIPPLHVIIADVSASAGRYSESFGFGSVLGAGGQLGLGLETELRTQLSQLYCDHNSELTVHEIAMPPVLRNGIGTHWLLPNSLTFTNPLQTAEPQTLSAKEVQKLVLALHQDPRPEFTGASKSVEAWAADEPSTKETDDQLGQHDENWKKLLKSLSQNPDGATACPSLKG